MAAVIYSPSERAVNAAAAAAAAVGRRCGSEVTALGVSGLTTPLDASVLKPDFDLCFDETELSS